MNKKAKKILKITLWSFVGLFAALILLILTSPLWIGSAAKAIAHSVVPGITGTSFKMNSASLNIFTGKLDVKGTVLGNPEGFSPNEAVSLARLYVDIKPSTIFSDTIYIEDILIEKPFVSYVSYNSTNNFDYIIANATKEDEAAEKEEDSQTTEESEKKLIIDRLRIVSGKAQLEFFPIPLPDMEFKDIGKKQNGATLKDIALDVFKSTQKQFGNLGNAFEGFADSLTDSFTNTTSEVVSETTKAISDSTEKATKALTDTTDAAVDAVKDGASSIFKKAGNLLGK